MKSVPVPSGPWPSMQCGDLHTAEPRAGVQSPRPYQLEAVPSGVPKRSTRTCTTNDTRARRPPRGCFARPQLPARLTRPSPPLQSKNCVQECRQETETSVPFSDWHSAHAVSSTLCPGSMVASSSACFGGVDERVRKQDGKNTSVRREMGWGLNRVREPKMRCSLGTRNPIQNKRVWARCGCPCPASVPAQFISNPLSKGLTAPFSYAPRTFSYVVCAHAHTPR